MAGWSVERLEDVTRSAQELMKLLEPKDFETLVDLVFSTSGWRRLGMVGRTQKTLDLDLLLPSTGERAFVQVKSKTTSAELSKYAGKLEEHGPYDRMFFVFHSGEAVIDDERVSIIGPKQLSEMVVDAGLVNWLIRKVSVQRHVEEAQQLVSEHKGRVARLRAAGNDTFLAETMLSALEANLKRFQEHKDWFGRREPQKD